MIGKEIVDDKNATVLLSMQNANSRHFKVLQCD